MTTCLRLLSDSEQSFSTGITGPRLTCPRGRARPSANSPPPLRLYAPGGPFAAAESTRNAVFGRSRRWGSHPAKEKRHETA